MKYRVEACNVLPPLGYMARFVLKVDDFMDVLITKSMLSALDGMMFSDKMEGKIASTHNFKSEPIDAVIKKEAWKNSYNIIIKYNYDEYIIPRHVIGQKAKCYCFQVVVDIMLMDGIDVIESKSKSLKIFDTRMKALLYLQNFSGKFALFYKKYYISQHVDYYGINDIRIGNNMVIYQLRILFSSQHNQMLTKIYRFNIVALERG